MGKQQIYHFYLLIQWREVAIDALVMSVEERDDLGLGCSQNK